MGRCFKKKYVNENVYDAAYKRLVNIFNKFDKVIVSFSGGKDSTALLNMTYTVANDLDRLPLEVHFYDEEMVHPTTIDYVQRVADRDGIDLKWWCLEFKHRNASSSTDVYWKCWDMDKQDLWVRELPKVAIVNHDKFRLGMSYQEFAQYIYDDINETVCMLIGLRAEESIHRYRAIANERRDNYITQPTYRNFRKASPIYDWMAKDVWIAVREFGWDYNRTYDLLNKTRHYNKLLQQRIGNPVGVEPLKSIWEYAECFPELWEKMVKRVPGINTALKYSNTELYGANDEDMKLPPGITWREFAHILMERYEPKVKKILGSLLNQAIKLHAKKAKTTVIPDVKPHPKSGYSWKKFCVFINKGDVKGRYLESLSTKAKK